MEQLIIEILASHPEGLLGSVIIRVVALHTNANRENIQDTLLRMVEDGILTTRPRASNDGDILYVLPKH